MHWIIAVTNRDDVIDEILTRIIWHRTDDLHRKALASLCIERCSSLFDVVDLEVGAVGKRWPEILTMSKFIALFERKGVKDLYGFTIRVATTIGRFMLDVRCYDTSVNSLLKNNVQVICSPEFWSTIDGREFIASILHLIPATIGLETTVTSRLVLFDDAVGFYPLWTDKDPDFFGTISAYFVSCHCWSKQNKELWLDEPPSTRNFRKLWMVYPRNVVSRLHIDDVDCEGKSLKDWIESDPRRGTLDQVAEHNAIWDIGHKNLERTVRELWTSGFFPCAEHFEIVGWSDRWLLPELRARASVCDIIGTDTVACGAKFVDGEEPDEVTAFKKMIGKA